MKKTNLLGVKITEDFRKDVDEAAVKMGITSAAFARRWLEVGTPFPKEIWEYIEKLSENYNKPHSEIILTIISKYLCDYIARQRLDPDTPYVVQEFAPMEGKPTYDNIFIILQDRALQRIQVQREKDKQIERLKWENDSDWWENFFVKRQLVKNHSFSQEEVEAIFSDAKYDARSEMWDRTHPSISEMTENARMKRESDQEQEKIRKSIDGNNLES